MTIKSERGSSSGPARARLHPDVLAQRVEDNLVLVHMDTNQIYNLNDSAARLWELLAAGLDVDEAKQQLLQEFDVSVVQLERDIALVLKTLADYDFVKLEG